MMREFFGRKSVKMFLAFTAVYAVALAFIFRGAWGLDKVPVAPDCQTTFPVDDFSNWLKELCGGRYFIAFDLLRFTIGRYYFVELQFALSAWLAALGVAYYLRGRKASLLASYGGGAVFGLMGYCFTLFSAGHLGWFLWLMHGPFAFGLTDRAVRKGKLTNWALLGAVLAWASVEQPDLWLMFTVMTFAYGVWCLIRERKAIKFGRVFVGVGITAVCALLVGMPQFGKAIFVEIANRKTQMAESAIDSHKPGGAEVKSPEEASRARLDKWLFCTSWSLPPEDTLEFVVPEIHGGSNDPNVYSKPGNKPYTGRLGQHGILPKGAKGRHPVTGKMLNGGDEYWMPYRQHSLYFGVISVMLAVIGCAGWIAMRKRIKANNSVSHDALVTRDAVVWGDAPFWICAAAVTYVCALGGFTPFYKIVFALPFGDLVRCPVKFVHLLEFAVAVLAGLGIEFVRENWGKTRAWIVPVLAVIAVVNVIDLARVDAKYLAVRDISFLRAQNAAAEDVRKAGGGKVFVGMSQEEGKSVVEESMRLHCAGVTNDLNAARYVLAGVNFFRSAPSIEKGIKESKYKVSGLYSIGQKSGIAKASQSSASMMLLENTAIRLKSTDDTSRCSFSLASFLTLISMFSTIAILLLSVRTKILRS